jgi:sodium-dependent dicarboxylate transporter 2/3/5
MDSEGVISEAEQRFERGRRTVGLALGPAIMALLYFMPMGGLSPQAHALAAILGLVVTWWITEPIPIAMTAVLGSVLAVLLGVAPAVKAFAPFAEPTVFLFLGSFIIARAMTVHGLDRRLARGILSLAWVRDGSSRVLFAFGLVAVLVSAWASNTATTAMLLPIGIGIVGSMSDALAARGLPSDPRKLRFGTAMMLMAAYGASVGGIATPVGTPPNLIGIALIETATKVHITFFQWMVMGVPLALLMFGVLFVMLRWMNPPELPRLQAPTGGPVEVRARWSRGEMNTLIAFLATVAMWLLPAIVAAIHGPASDLAKTWSTYLPEAVAAMLGACLLFLLPTDWQRREFTLGWDDAVRIDWGTLLLFGGGLSLGKLMFDTGLAEAIGRGLLDLTGASDTWSLTLAAIYASILISEATSNTAAANMAVPVMLALATAAGVDPLPPAIGATLGASWGFMLPVSTPPNAIVYGSGMIPITKMIRAGIVFDLVGGLLLWLGLRILMPLAGLA